MLILALDTSGEICSVAVSDGVVCFAEYAFRHERHLIERLPGIVQFVLRDAHRAGVGGLTLSDIDAFAVGLGPGSFTGVRVGVTMAKVWAMTLDKPVVGISSLDALAEPLLFSGIPLACVAPTRRTESVVAFYVGGTVAPIAPPSVVANDTITTIARERLAIGANRLLLVGEIAAAICAVSPPESVEKTTVRVGAPKASVIARLALGQLVRGEADDTDSLVPLYVTPPPTG